MMKRQQIRINRQFKTAFKLMENTQKNIFVTGKAGTGKSTLLEYFRTHTSKKVAVLAPTGIAALNINGQTIHSFFKFQPNITQKGIRRLSGTENKIYQNIDTIIIDEISMVRADLIDCIDKFMRLNRNDNAPFGGVQMIFIGDLYQLPPIVTSKEKKIFSYSYDSPYFFDSNALKNSEIVFIELETIYRQKDDAFIEILNSIRNNTVTLEHLRMLNKRVKRDFIPPKRKLFITLTTTNEQSSKINTKHLSKINTKTFKYFGKIKGDFDAKSLPTEKELVLKPNSQVMFVNNDADGRWVNGTMGKIISIQKNKKHDIIIVKKEDCEEVFVEPYTWSISKLYYDDSTKSLESTITGSFRQYPLKLAWAITIHKSQGKTFDNVIIDIGKGTFSHGQVYVALSRCRTLEGIILRKPIQKRHILTDWRISRFFTQVQTKSSHNPLSFKEKISIIKSSIKKDSMLNITYLKPNGEKSQRTVKPKLIGKMFYKGKPFMGLRAYCLFRKSERVFRIERIIDIQEINTRYF